MRPDSFYLGAVWGAVVCRIMITCSASLVPYSLSSMALRWPALVARIAIVANGVGNQTPCASRGGGAWSPVCAAGLSLMWVDELNGYHIDRGTIAASPSSAAFLVCPDSDRRRLALDVPSVVTAPRWY